ncbi:TonB-dependent receptor, partial [Sphingomonas bacterium]|uniref:TonB-dependent receptor n=1 Tax=Sphingomonas bacterium TaxID=1895847 RepID=UPI001576F724
MNGKLILLLATGLPAVALAQTTPAPVTGTGAAPKQAATATDDGGDEEIVVRGQKPPGSVVGDIPPEQTLTPADIRAYGVNSISDLLSELSPQTTGVRGRGGEAPVVLLNGKRISSFAEIRDIPTEAILRAEILPEEVALKYGFTADQKVVNFVLRRRFRSWTAAGEGGLSTEGGGAGGNVNGDIFRIQGDNRVNIDARYNRSDRLLESQRGLASPAASGADLSDFRTLRPATRTETLNAVYARAIGGGISATANATLTGSQSDALQGLPSAALIVPAGSPFSTTGTTVNRTFGDDALGQRVRSLTEHLGLGLNGNAGAWRWNFTGNYDHGDSRTASETGLDTTAIQARLTARDPLLNPNGDLTTALGGLLTNRARAVTNDANLQMVANGALFALPAGAVTTAVKLGGTLTAIDGRSERIGVVTDTSLSRRAGNAQINLDLPIASRKTGTLSILGTLTANLNLAVNQLSDFGTQRTYGGGFNWTPVAPVSFLFSYTDDQGVPTVQQLGNPVLITADSRVFDAFKGVTADVVAISGGNPALRADDRQVIKLGAQFKPLPKSDLNFTVNYVKSRIRDAVAGLPEPTAAIENAFPDRFVRNGNGDLTRIDTRPVNFDREDEQSLRTGFTLSIPLKPSAATIAAFRKAAQARFGNTGLGQRPPGGGGGDQPPPPGA